MIGNSSMIGIHFFAHEEITRIARFEAYWRASHRDDPDNYPMWMEPAEWEEQYRCWQEIS